MLLFIGGMMLGAFIALALHCMLIVAKEADEKIKWYILLNQIFSRVHIESNKL